MNELEQALRSRLSKGDASDTAFRQKVYRSAIEAIERHTANEPDPQRRKMHKQRLAKAIRETEAYYAGAAAPSAIVADRNASARVAPDVSIRPERREPVARPARDIDRGAHLRAEPRRPSARPQANAFPEVGDDGRAAAGAPRSRVRRAPFALMLSVVVLIALVGAGAWWVMSTGAFQSAAERDTSVPNPPLQLDNESFPGNQADTGSSGPARIAAAGERDSGWVTLFEPSDPTTITLEGNASAAIDGDPFGQFARIVSPDSDSVIGIEVPPGTLEMFAGKSVQFSIVARADDDAETQMSLTCDLAEFGDCGRRRFDVIASDNEFLFQVDLPQGVRASRPGRLLLVTDIENRGRAVKLSAVRVRELK